MAVKKLRSLVVLFCFFAVFLLLLLLTYQQLQLTTLLDAVATGEKERLYRLAEQGKTALTGKISELKQDPYPLHALAETLGVKQILLIETDGTLLADSNREVKEKETVPPSPLLRKASENGETQYLMPSKSKTHSRFGEIWLPIEDRQGRYIAHITVSLPATEHGGAWTLLLLIRVFGWVGGGVLVYYTLRFLFVTSRAQEHERETVGSLLENTFQGAIRDLKQKGQALEQMKDKAEAYAETMEHYNENILRSVTSGVLAFDREHNVTAMNPAAETILNLKRSEVVGKGHESVFGPHTEIASFLKETFDLNQHALRKECELTRRDGKKICLGLTPSALRDREGNQIGAILVFSDLTEMKLLQEQVELKKRLVLMGEVSAFIAHEFRNYMGTILGYASLLSKGFQPADPKQEMTRAITHELSKMEQLITELLAYGKKPALTVKRIPMLPLIEETLQPFRSGHPDISFQTTFEDCEAVVDAVLLRQALSNLIQNGLDAMDETPNKTLHVQVGYWGDRFIEIKISDTGRGIAPGDLDKIFLPFFTTKQKGTGLGLALTHKIILSHNGTIGVDSQEGVGTTFMITLPVHRF